MHGVSKKYRKIFIYNGLKFLETTSFCVHTLYFLQHCKWNLLQAMRWNRSLTFHRLLWCPIMRFIRRKKNKFRWSGMSDKLNLQKSNVHSKHFVTALLQPLYIQTSELFLFNRMKQCLIEDHYGMKNCKRSGRTALRRFCLQSSRKCTMSVRSADDTDGELLFWIHQNPLCVYL